MPNNCSKMSTNQDGLGTSATIRRRAGPIKWRSGIGSPNRSDECCTTFQYTTLDAPLPAQNFKSLGKCWVLFDLLNIPFSSTFLSAIVIVYVGKWFLICFFTSLSDSRGVSPPPWQGGVASPPPWQGVTEALFVAPGYSAVHLGIEFGLIHVLWFGFHIWRAVKSSAPKVR